MAYLGYGAWSVQTRYNPLECARHHASIFRAEKPNHLIYLTQEDGYQRCDASPVDGLPIDNYFRIRQNTILLSSGGN